MKIGDTSPIPADADLTLLPAIRYRKALTKRIGSIKSGNQAIMAAKKVMAERSASDARAESPVEQAKTHLRRRGYVPVCQDVHGYHAGQRTFPTAKLFKEFARSKGWVG